ncbi:DNA repair protein RadC [Candidatus Woesearchaeota archaeon]|nr:DNA repair protein RadC [Candidatus Woesearchaeota archaeon]
MRIKEISLDNRPRERMEKQGASVLSDAELLAVILQKGTREENVIDMSHRLISKYGVDKLSFCSLNELQEIKGIGKAKASQILALFEFNKRHTLSKQNGKPIKSAKDVYDYCSPKLVGTDKEHFMILHLDTRNRVIKDEIVSVGTLNSSLIHPREVFKSAIKESANSVILIHNHPSGVVEPSDEDIKITDVLIKSGELLSIKVLDHVIVGSEGYYSFNERRD